jgi:phage tail-like protein
MRGAVAGMRAPQPIVTLMPAVYQEDEFTNRFTAGLDDTLAPIMSVLDCLYAYIDPALAPEDFLDWLAGWVGLELDEHTPLYRKRAAVAHAVTLYRMRGTMTGLRAHLELMSGGEAELADNGGVAWSTSPGAPLPGQDTPRLAVRVRVPNPEPGLAGVLDGVVTWAKPAHVVHRVEVVGK